MEIWMDIKKRRASEMVSVWINLKKSFSSFSNLFKRELTTQSRNSNNVLWQSEQVEEKYLTTEAQR